MLIIALVIGLGFAGLLLKLLKRPIKWCFKLLIHIASGFVYLFLFNLLGAAAGFSLETDWLNCLISGAFGIPGVILLFILKYLI